VPLATAKYAALLNDIALCKLSAAQPGVLELLMQAKAAYEDAKETKTRNYACVYLDIGNYYYCSGSHSKAWEFYEQGRICFEAVGATNIPEYEELMHVMDELGQPPNTVDTPHSRPCTAEAEVGEEEDDLRRVLQDELDELRSPPTVKKKKPKPVLANSMTLNSLLEDLHEESDPNLLQSSGFLGDTCKSFSSLSPSSTLSASLRRRGGGNF